MHRREMLAASSAAVVGLSTFPFGWAAAAEKKKQKLLYFTRSVEFEHSVVRPGEDGLSHSGSSRDCSSMSSCEFAPILLPIMLPAAPIPAAISGIIFYSSACAGCCSALIWFIRYC